MLHQPEKLVFPGVFLSRQCSFVSVGREQEIGGIRFVCLGQNLAENESSGIIGILVNEPKT